MARMNHPTFRRFRQATLNLTAAALATTSPLNAEAPVSAAVPLLNGTDLTGWKAPSAETFWKVADGILTGKSDPAKKGSVLQTAKSYGDFDLESDVRWTGEIDSGFMFRKPEIQLQIGVSRSLKKDMTGCFYIGGKDAYPEAGQAKERAGLLKPGQWNHFRLRAKGDTFTVWINDTEAVTFTSSKYRDPAPIGLQIHGGLEMKVEFRNLKITEL